MFRKKNSMYPRPEMTISKMITPSPTVGQGDHPFSDPGAGQEVEPGLPGTTLRKPTHRSRSLRAWHASRVSSPAQNCPLKTVNEIVERGKNGEPEKSLKEDMEERRESGARKGGKRRRREDREGRRKIWRGSRDKE